MDYSHVNNATGKWANKEELSKAGVTSAKIVSETKPEPSKFTNEDGTPKNQDVAKVHFEGQPESVKVAMNWQSLKALASKFGTDSTAWQGHPLKVEFEKYKDTKGISRIKLYLVPEGYAVMDDAEGKTVIMPEGTTFDLPPFDDELANLPPADEA